MTFMWRRYTPKTNRLSLPRIFSSHLPLEGKRMGIEWKTACQFGTELRPGDWPPDHEGARRADVDGIEVPQLFGKHGRSEGPVTADVDPPQKNHECHAFPPAGAAKTG